MFQHRRSSGWTSGALKRKTCQDPKGLLDVMSSHMLCNQNSKKAKQIFGVAIVFLFHRKEALTPAGMLALNGVGLKILFETQRDFGDKRVIGIGCDSHMCKIFGAVGWHSIQVDEKTGDYANANDKVALEMMKWVPYDQWGHMNRCYAGLGQVLNDPHESIRIATKLLQKATTEQRPEIFKILREYKVSLLGQNK